MNKKAQADFNRLVEKKAERAYRTGYTCDMYERDFNKQFRTVKRVNW